MSSWKKGARASSAHLVTLTVLVRVHAERRAELERVLFAVSDPDHANYGKHRSINGISGSLGVPDERTA